MNARTAVGARGSEERESYPELVQQSPPGVSEVRAKRSELTPSHGNASIMLVEAECQRRTVGRRSETASAKSSSCAVEVLQEVMSSPLDARVSPFGSPILTREKAASMESTEVPVAERVPGLGLVRRIVGEAEIPLPVVIPRVRLQEGVLVFGARLDVSPGAVEDVLVRVDELPCSLHGALVHGVGGHRPILARMSVAAKSSAPKVDLFDRSPGVGSEP